MRRILGLVVISSTLALSACVADADPGEAGEDEALEQADLAPVFEKAVLPTIQQHVNNQAPPGGGGPTQAGIFYHGGPVMLGTVNAYYIWYGNWAGNSATTILTNFMSNLGGSSHWNINTTYANSAGTKVSNSLTLAGQTSVAYPYGTALTDAQIQTVVKDAITGNKLPKDTNGIYFVLTSADVTTSSGFCSQYCGWHSHGTIGGSDIKYSFVGNPDRCPGSCAPQTVSPNGNVGADGMASIIAHEAEEATTDPDLNAWYDKRGAENADKCAWTWGTTTLLPSGAKYNMTLGGANYLIQQNWVNANNGFCAKSY